MKSKWAFMIVALLLLALAVGPGQAQGPEPPGQGTEPQGEVGIQAAVGTAFTYQGQLKSGGNPVNGNCDFQFSLYDAADLGTQIGTTQTKSNVSVSNGLFTTSLDFGSTAFQGDARWLQIAVKCTGDASYTTLSPRQALTAAPYALGLRPGAAIVGQEGVYSALSVSNGYPGGIWLPEKKAVSAWTSDGTALWGAAGSGTGVLGYATATSGTTYGVYGESDSTDGYGVYGKATATSGDNIGVYGESASPVGYGVYGVNTSSGAGVTGVSISGHGVVGAAQASTGYVYGVWGGSHSTNGRGVDGHAYATSGQAIGVYGQSNSTDGYGVYGWAVATSGYTYGVYGRSTSTDGYGVYGVNTSSGAGVTGVSSTGDGVRGESSGANKSGVYGRSNSTAGYGVYGWAVAASGYTYGVYGESTSTGGTGVYGYASATSGPAWGVWGESASSTDGRGVVGYATAASGTTYGVYGYSASPTGYAGYFSGDVHVEGNFSASGIKSFKIDHPLDPANRYLYHFAQEGPEVQNVYNGVVTLDAQGEAVVTLPAYFEALNAGPYRYQLTAIGAPMPNLYIAQEIQGHTFRIAGGVPGKKVSWEVTAVRHDPYLRDHPVQAEVDKPAEEQGTYLYPEGYGQPREMGLDYQRNADLLERMPESPSAGGGE